MADVASSPVKLEAASASSADAAPQPVSQRAAAANATAAMAAAAAAATMTLAATSPAKASAALKRTGGGGRGDESATSPAKRRRAPAAEDAKELRIGIPGSRAARAVPAFGSLERVDDAYGDALLIERYHQGGASVVHVFPDAIAPSATADQRRRFARVCYDIIFGETQVPGVADHCFGIIHRGAKDMPNFLRSIARKFPKTEVDRQAFGQVRMSETVTIEDYVGAIDRTLENGTHRAGTMRTISLVGCMQEEKGGYFGDVLNALEKSFWLKDVLPWGAESRYDDLDPAESDDGPIMADGVAAARPRPGEQVVPLQELGEAKRSQDPTPARRKRSDLDRLQLMPRNERPREKVVEDRTGCHADMSGLYPERHAVAAVGLVQGMDGVYDLKDIIAFHAGDMDRLAEACGLYFQEEPKDQLLDPQFWADEAKLNQLRRMGIRYAHVRLQCDDIYFIPRKVVHQFKTVGACVSVTWHLKYHAYYNADGVPNQLIGLPGGDDHADVPLGPQVFPVVSPNKKPLMSAMRADGSRSGSPASPASARPSPGATARKAAVPPASPVARPTVAPVAPAAVPVAPAEVPVAPAAVPVPKGEKRKPARPRPAVAPVNQTSGSSSSDTSSSDSDSLVSSDFDGLGSDEDEDDDDDDDA